MQVIDTKRVFIKGLLQMTMYALLNAVALQSYDCTSKDRRK